MVIGSQGKDTLASSGVVCDATQALEQKQRILEQRDDLERQAGVYYEADRARGGLRSEFDLDQLSPTERAAAEQANKAYKHRKIREIYFSVADRSLRRALIQMGRREHEAWLDTVGGYVAEAEQEVANAEAALDRLPRKSAALAAAACVAAGYWAAGWRGAICGAVLGYIAGKDKLNSHRANVRRAIREAKRNLKDMRQKQSSTDPEPFTADEWLSGEHDPNHDCYYKR